MLERRLVRPEVPVPPEKRVAKVLKLGLGRLEILLLERLQVDAGGNASDHARAAIIEYAMNHPGLKDSVLNLIAIGKEAGARDEHFAREIRQFLEKRRLRRAPTRPHRNPEPTLTGDLAPARRTVDPIDDDDEEPR